LTLIRRRCKNDSYSCIYISKIVFFFRFQKVQRFGQARGKWSICPEKQLSTIWSSQSKTNKATYRGYLHNHNFCVLIFIFLFLFAINKPN
jgi:hypothetical protein